MASLVVAGDVSGSVTLSAPSAAGSVTITLPSSSGTMAVTGGSPSFATLTVTGDATINSLTVGKGGGAVSGNTALGQGSLQGSNSGSGYNTAVGFNTLYSNTTGAYNTAVGNYNTMYANTSGSSNIAIGGGDAVANSALRFNTTGSYNVAIGIGSLGNNTTASNNTAVGYQAGYTGSTATYNCFMGTQAGYSATGSYNTCIGGDSGGNFSSGTFNTFVGYGSGSAITTGGKNTIIGKYSGNNGGLDIRTANNYIVLSDGDGNPRGIFNGSGDLFVGKTGNDGAAVGIEARANGFLLCTRNSDTPFFVNRLTNDGTLVSLRQDTVEEGTISVSGTTVSYNGGHLSRWSQLLDNSKDDTLLKGTVMSNLDDMCVWTKDGEVLPNEQLNKMKVSDVEGDTNVAGVFVNWTRDEDCNSDDMNVAMTGDMIIRIAQGVVVQKGDLLMSAGDGTAKPQGDDIRRSKTVAKVTSNHVTCTYEDGSYCVPCVLMAC